MSTPKKPRQRAPRAIAIGFIAAFALSTATIIYTGLKVGAPQRASREAPRAVEAPLREAPSEAKVELDERSSVTAPDADATGAEDPTQ